MESVGVGGILLVAAGFAALAFKHYYGWKGFMENDARRQDEKRERRRQKSAAAESDAPTSRS